MWPPSYKQGIKKVRSYKKSNSQKRTIDDVNEDDEPKLSRLPLSRPVKIWNTATKVLEHGNLQAKLLADNKRRIVSRRRVFKGGGSLTARKNNKAKLARLQEVKARNGLLTIEDIMPPDREPDKYPILVEALLLTDEGHEGLVQVIRELEQLVPPVEQDHEVKIFTQAVVMEEEEEVPEYRDSSPVDQLNVENANYLFTNSVIIFVYTNDIAILSCKEDYKTATDFKAKLKKKYKMHDIREMEWFLNKRISRDREQRKI
ncbi:hypothetical protein NA56DRAFT_707333 [Hyaloscypha hepaticicola]|uniref:Reverse transcriptase Ty1/copia-type domain-containing protein n=1 Tax=Hyaloscypha hepaticicola TaxID=2082293 RepID=A0A2J6PV72_9HELO|nr:hypothetical protein NA56DRAFT_707333 [Hyaloscypha hepaticicola]